MGAKASEIQTLFITVDPERDTPEVMKEYIAMFDERITGLTGTKEQVKAAQDVYKVYAEKFNDPELSEYTMNHSSFTFFMGPDGELIDIFSTSDKAEEITDIVMQAL
jgi:protein SCO1/2